MALLTPLYMQPASGDPALPYSAQADRVGLLGTIFSREGVIDLRGGHLKVTQRALGANFTVDVAPGRCAIMGDDISDQGTYECTSTTVVNLTVPAKPASGSRTHRVIARVRDKLSKGTWSQYDWIIEILPDTGSGVPAEPDTAITLALITVSSTATSVVNSMIDDSVRKRASVGTAAVEGTFSLYSGFNANDATRPLRWAVNPDGWVQLSGWVRWTDTNTAVAAGEQRTFGGTALVDPAVKPPAIRDFTGATSFGAMHFAVFANGLLYFRPVGAITLAQNSSWFSFDGCAYRI